MVSTLDHPHILRVFDAFDHGGPHDPAFYLICEVCNGGDLQQELGNSRSNLPVTRVARYIRQVLLAMNYCHCLAVPVIHRDLKPANVMKTNTGPDSDIKVIDFGLAILSKAGTDEKSKISGTPEFMAPEVWTGKYGHEADCWSIGMMLYYLLVAALPFKPHTNLDYRKLWNDFLLRFPASQGWSNRRLRSARDLIRQLLHRDPSSRMTAASALKSEFIKKHGKSKGFTGSSFATMKTSYNTFTRAPKFVEGLKTYGEMPRILRIVLLLSACRMDAAQFSKVRQMFDSIDQDHDGFISGSDMQQFLSGWTFRMGRMAQALKGFSGGSGAPSSADTGTMLRLADLDEDGAIGYTEFLVVWLYANQNKSDSCLRQAFKSLQAPDGLVSRKEVQQALCSKQMQELGGVQQMAADIASIFPAKERMTFERFAECLQQQEDLGPDGDIEFASRPVGEQAESSSFCGLWQLTGSPLKLNWTRLSGEDAYEEDDSDLDVASHNQCSVFCCCPESDRTFVTH
eukprot:TRINITY_DN41765_c0_g1_i1.p1 TRINITY_DN41765_c0_g1~~TRINITY_DN41765_c0_g1_i1.p1  ORF type:complete len:602 (+),score=109.19 TRINITY_DN41765_c0_g1_i1:268-1806(+)